MTRAAATNPRLALAVAATALLFGAGIAPLPTLLVCSPLWALVWLREPQRRWQGVLLRAGAVGLAAWHIVADGLLAQAMGLQLVPHGALLRAWVAGGVFLLWVAACQVIWRSHADQVRKVLRGLLLSVALAAVVLPLPLIYRTPVTTHTDPRLGGLAVDLDLGSVRLHSRAYPAAFTVTTITAPNTPSSPWGDVAGNGIVVLIPGMADGIEEFENRVIRLTGMGWAVIGYDPRGCGQSSPAAISWGLHEAADLQALWPSIQNAAAGRPVVVYGISLGGATAVLAANQLPGCTGLIIESAYAEFASLPGVTALPLPVQLAGRMVAMASGAGDPFAVRPIDAAMHLSSMPTVMGWTADDAVVPAWQSHELAAVVPGSVDVVRPDGGHLDLVDHPAWWDAIQVMLAEQVLHP